MRASWDSRRSLSRTRSGSIGVGEIDGDPAIRPELRHEPIRERRFQHSVAKNLGITPEQRPWLFVVKKNKTVLERLYSWIRDHVANAWDPYAGRRPSIKVLTDGNKRQEEVVTHLPLLSIDDEADHASVDTGEQLFDERWPARRESPADGHQQVHSSDSLCVYQLSLCWVYGDPVREHLHSRTGRDANEGPDLFPSAFIINLAAASSYVGPAKVFGLKLRSDEAAGFPY